jgi:hypothetical protein
MRPCSGGVPPSAAADSAGVPPVSPNGLRSPSGTGETPALHPARETRARPCHGFSVVAAATMGDCSVNVRCPMTAKSDSPSMALRSDRYARNIAAYRLLYPLITGATQLFYFQYVASNTEGLPLLSRPVRPLSPMTYARSRPPPANTGDKQAKQPKPSPNRIVKERGRRPGAAPRAFRYRPLPARFHLAIMRLRLSSKKWSRPRNPDGPEPSTTISPWSMPAAAGRIANKRFCGGRQV